LECLVGGSLTFSRESFGEVAVEGRDFGGEELLVRFGGLSRDEVDDGTTSGPGVLPLGEAGNGVCVTELVTAAEGSGDVTGASETFVETRIIPEGASSDGLAEFIGGPAVTAAVALIEVGEGVGEADDFTLF